jgi:hypothetical protein
MTRSAGELTARTATIGGSPSVIAVGPTEVASLIAPVEPGGLPTTRDLLLQALLHLPRVARNDGMVDSSSANDEIARLHAIRAAELAPLRSLAESPTSLPRLNDIEVRTVDATDAAPILEHFHYLRSFRHDSVTVGAIHRGRIAALCSLSPLDLPAVAARLPIDLPTEAAVVSRVFAFDWAPRNVISYMLARAAQASRAVLHDDVRLLVTYLNPNMGFSGASYRAANWLPLGIETGTRYAYLNGCYITDRQLLRLPPDDRPRVEYSQMRLRPLILLCRFLERRCQRTYPRGFQFVFDRPRKLLETRL